MTSLMYGGVASSSVSVVLVPPPIGGYWAKLSAGNLVTHHRWIAVTHDAPLYMGRNTGEVCVGLPGSKLRPARGYARALSPARLLTFSGREWVFSAFRIRPQLGRRSSGKAFCYLYVEIDRCVGLFYSPTRPFLEEGLKRISISPSCLRSRDRPGVSTPFIIHSSDQSDVIKLCARARVVFLSNPILRRG